MPAAPPNALSTPSAAKQLAGFIAKFDPEVAALLRSTRSALRALLPTANEPAPRDHAFETETPPPAHAHT
jgi:hypothetical protein